MTLGGGRAGLPVGIAPPTVAVGESLGCRTVRDGLPRTGVEFPAMPRENPEDSAWWTPECDREGPATSGGDCMKLPGTAELPSEALASPMGLLVGEARVEPARSQGDPCILDDVDGA